LPAVPLISKDLAVDSHHVKPEGFLINRLSRNNVALNGGLRGSRVREALRGDL
jgi:hypothetical protein